MARLSSGAQAQVRAGPHRYGPPAWVVSPVITRTRSRPTWATPVTGTVCVIWGPPGRVRGRPQCAARGPRGGTAGGGRSSRRATRYQSRCSGVPGTPISASVPAAQFRGDRVPGDQRDAEPDAGGLPDRPVGADHQRQRRDVHLGEQRGRAGPGPRAGLAQQPGLAGQPGQQPGRVPGGGRPGGVGGQVGSGHHDKLVRPDGVDGHLPPGLGPAADHEVDQVPVEQRPHLVPVARPPAGPRSAGARAGSRPGCRGTTCSAAVVTAAIRSSPRSGSAQAAAARPASSSRPTMRRT